MNFSFKSVLLLRLLISDIFSEWLKKKVMMIYFIQLDIFFFFVDTTLYLHFFPTIWRKCYVWKQTLASLLLFANNNSGLSLFLLKRKRDNLQIKESFMFFCWCLFLFILLIHSFTITKGSPKPFTADTFIHHRIFDPHRTPDM